MMREDRGEGTVLGGPAARGLRTRVRTMVALVACCGAVLWAARVIWESVPVNAWVASLNSEDTLDRRAAARRLGGIGPEEAGVALPALAAALADDDDEVSATAARSLGSVALTVIRTPGGRARAVAAVDALTRALSDRRSEVRAAVTQALGSVASQVPIEPPPALIAALRRDGSEEVRAEAAAALGQFRAGLDAAIPPLFDGLAADGIRVRTACNDALTRDARKPSPVVVPFLIRTLREGRDTRARYRAATLLGRVEPRPEDAVPALIAALREPLGLRPASVSAFQMRVPGSTPAAESPNLWDPACEAARSLAVIAPAVGSADQAVTALTAALRSEHPWRRGAAAQGLFLIGKTAAPATPALIAALNQALADKDGDAPDGGSWYPRALGEAAPGSASAGEAISALTEALNSKQAGVSAYAAESLGRFGPAAAPVVPRLRALLDGPDRFASSKARAAIKMIKGEPEDTKPLARSSPLRMTFP